MMKWKSPLSTSLAILVLAFLGACHGNDPNGNGVETPELTCVDHDHDSYGVGCEAGFDCDDFDGEVWAECGAGDPCAVPRAGCPCETEGEEVSCRTTQPVTSDDGSELCYAGVRTCEGGEWGICASLTPYLPEAAEEAGAQEPGTSRESILGNAERCEDSCDSGCHSVYSCPSTIDLTDENAVNIDYDLGGTLGEGVNQVEVGAATVLAVGETDGYFRQVVEMTCPEDEAGIWWSVDYDIDFIEPSDGQYIQVDVRTADLENDLRDPLPWSTAVLCPDTLVDADCTPPTVPWDRQYTEDGNVYEALGEEAAQGRWIEVVARLHRDTADLYSPRLSHVEVYFYCDDAS